MSRLTTICSTNHQFVVQPLRVWFGRSSSAAARSILVHRVCVCLLCFVHLFFHLWLSTALVSKRCYKSQITAQANRNPKLLLNREYAECVTYSVDNVLLLVITTYRLKISKSQCWRLCLCVWPACIQLKPSATVHPKHTHKKSRSRSTITILSIRSACVILEADIFNLAHTNNKYIRRPMQWSLIRSVWQKTKDIQRIERTPNGTNVFWLFIHGAPFVYLNSNKIK